MQINFVYECEDNLWVEIPHSIVISCSLPPNPQQKTRWPKYLSHINKLVDWPGKNKRQVCISGGSWE